MMQNLKTSAAAAIKGDIEFIKLNTRTKIE